MAEFAAPITDLGDKIANLKITEAVALRDYLKEKYSIEPAAGGGGMIAPVVEKKEKKEEPKVQTEFTVFLEGLTDDTKKIAVIKAVREITACGLNDGKTLVDGSKTAPKAIKENVSKEEAEKVKKTLEDAGGKVSIK
jgi:large subunit ribosomal protein L7/L12